VKTSTLRASESPPLLLVSVTVRATDGTAGAVKISTAETFPPESKMSRLTLELQVRPVPLLVTVCVTPPELDAHNATSRLLAGAVKLAVGLGVVPVTMAGLEASTSRGTYSSHTT
jgi:hypothetical protein